jgi:signal transduction histidine kinase/HAMP domain-containing protein
VRLRLSIGTTIFGAFVAMGLLLAAVGGYGLYVLQAAGDFVVELYDRPLMALNFDRAANLDFAQMEKELIRRAHAAEADRPAIDIRIERLAATFKEDLAVAAERSLYDDEKKALRQIEELVARWNEARYNPKSAVSGQSPDALADRLAERFDLLAELANGHSFVERRKVISAVAFFRYSSLAALFLAILLSGLITLILVRRIILPLRHAARVADRIAEGDLEAALPAGGPDETGQLLRSMAVMQQSIRDMVKREKARRRSAQNRLVDALEHTHEAIVLVDAQDRIMLANSRLENFFPDLAPWLEPGATFTEVFRQVEGVIGALAPADLEAADDRAIDASQPEKELRLPDGRWLRIGRSRTQDGGFILVLSDFSDIKEREERLHEARLQAEAASAAKITFLANMSHELRTPLNAIIGFSEVMASEIFGKLGNQSYVEYAKDIQACGNHLLAVINSVLDLSKSETGKLELACETVDLVQIVESSVTIVRDQCARAHLQLHAVPPAEPIELSGDPAKLRQVLLNLLSNAMKFTPPGGTITVRTEARSDGLAIVEVADTGIGMSPQQIPTALAAFGQIDSRVERRYEGTGLGLPLSKAIVELHGGLIAIDSAPSAGTKVRVILPRETPGAAVASAAAA